MYLTQLKVQNLYFFLANALEMADQTKWKHFIHFIYFVISFRQTSRILPSFFSWFGTFPVFLSLYTEYNNFVKILNFLFSRYLNTTKSNFPHLPKQFLTLTYSKTGFVFITSYYSCKRGRDHHETTRFDYFWRKIIALASEFWVGLFWLWRLLHS